MAVPALNTLFIQQYNDSANASDNSTITTDTNLIIINITDVSTNMSFQRYSQLNQVTMFLMVYFLPIIFIFGILGNTISFVIFLSEKMRRVSTNIYLAALSASNSVFLVAVAVAWTDMVGWKLMHVDGICQAAVYLTYCSGFLSVWLVVCITVENFVINFFLHKASSHCTIRRALSFVVLLCVTSFLLYDFAIWTTGVVQINNTQAQYCQTYTNYQSIVEIFTLVDIIITLVIPSIVILALVIPTCVRNVSCRARASRLRPSIILSRRERALLRVTRLLCVIIVSYVLLTAPSHLNKLRLLFGTARMQSGSSTDMFIVFIVQTLYFLSFSVNFIYFLIWGKNFRHCFCCLFLAFYRILCRCRQKFFRAHARW